MAITKRQGDNGSPCLNPPPPTEIIHQSSINCYQESSGSDALLNSEFKSAAIPPFLLTNFFYLSLFTSLNFFLNFFSSIVEIESCFFQLSVSTIERNCIKCNTLSLNLGLKIRNQYNNCSLFI